MFAAFRQFLRSPLLDVPAGQRPEFLRDLVAHNLTRARLGTVALGVVLVVAILLVDVLNLPRLTPGRTAQAAPVHVGSVLLCAAMLLLEGCFRGSSAPTQRRLVLGFVLASACACPTL